MEHLLHVRWKVELSVHRLNMLSFKQTKAKLSMILTICCQCLDHEVAVESMIHHANVKLCISMVIYGQSLQKEDNAFTNQATPHICK